MRQLAGHVHLPPRGAVLTLEVRDPHDEPRVLPEVDEFNREFWTGGRDGELRINRCQSCGYWDHPAHAMCPRCKGRDLSFEATSGKGRVFSFAVNHHQWRPGLKPPYAVALVELAEQADLRVTTNIVNCDPADLSIDMAVEVRFIRQDDFYIPVFQPDDSAGEQ